MKIRLEPRPLATATAWVARSLPARPPVPILGGILIDAHPDGAITLSGFDYETSTRVQLDAVVHEPGRVLVSARLLADITKALPAKPVELTIEGTKVRIVCGAARFLLPTLPIEEYPAQPEMPQVTGTVDRAALAAAVAHVATAAGRDDSLPMLTGIRVELDGPRMTLAATDRFRLAVRELDWTPTDPTLSAAALIPARALLEMTKGTTGDRVEVALATDGGMLGVAAAGTRTLTRLLDVEFPRFRQLIPAAHASAAIVDVAELVAGVKRAALVTDRVAQVHMAFTGAELTLTAGGDDVGSAEETVPCTLDGPPITIAFNPQYLLDALAALPTARAQITFSTPTRPGLVRAVDDAGGVDQSALFLLMPVRLPG